MTRRDSCDLLKLGNSLQKLDSNHTWAVTAAAAPWEGGAEGWRPEEEGAGGSHRWRRTPAAGSPPSSRRRRRSGGGDDDGGGDGGERSASSFWASTTEHVVIFEFGPSCSALHAFRDIFSVLLNCFMQDKVPKLSA